MDTRYQCHHHEFYLWQRDRADRHEGGSMNKKEAKLKKQKDRE
jgi:hypothetical protein